MTPHTNTTRRASQRLAPTLSSLFPIHKGQKGKKTNEAGTW